ncbi:Thiol-disulfide oxidoreductase ResA [compost metagenome]
MKKNTFLFCLLFFTLQHNAQLPFGAMAPDFTATDLDGNSHTLSTYLNAGKSVIIEFGGTGCGPCWTYKKTESLQDLYNAFGPPGSNELMIFQIENYTNYNKDFDKLHGIPKNTEFGNWVEGTPFPIILSQTVNDAYMVEYLPTIYKICPDGKTSLIGQSSAINARNIISNSCAMLTGVQNYGRVLETTNGFCIPQGNFKAKFKNYGFNNITSAVFKLKQNATVVGTVNYSGALVQFDSATIIFDEIAVDSSANYTVEIQSINGVANFNPKFSQADLPFHISRPTGIDLQIKIHTYSCPNKMSWNIVNSLGVIIVNGGPYSGYENNCGGPNADTIIEHTAALPDITDCYTLNLFSTNPYGWKNFYWGTPDTITPGVEIFSGGSLIYSNLEVGNFGYRMTVENFISSGLLTVDEIKTDPLVVFPNPTSGIIQITGSDSFEVSVFDIMGKEVFHSENIDKNNSFNISQLSNGIYIARFLDKDNNETVRKVILDR